ncbi:hypothetical protein D3C85_610370 [compost metagenome]
MSEEQPKAIRMEKSEKRIWKLSTSREKTKPMKMARPIPSRPPSRLTITASIRNCCRMSD